MCIPIDKWTHVLMTLDVGCRSEPFKQQDITLLKHKNNDFLHELKKDKDRA